MKNLLCLLIVTFLTSNGFAQTVSAPLELPTVATKIDSISMTNLAFLSSSPMTLTYGGVVSKKVIKIKIGFDYYEACKGTASAVEVQGLPFVGPEALPVSPGHNLTSH